MTAHLGWSSRPPSKRLRISIDVRSGSSTRYSEIEVRAGEKVSINLQAGIVDSGDELYHRGKMVDARDGREALRVEEERLRHYQPKDVSPKPRRASMTMRRSSHTLKLGERGPLTSTTSKRLWGWMWRWKW